MNTLAYIFKYYPPKNTFRVHFFPMLQRCRCGAVVIDQRLLVSCVVEPIKHIYSYPVYFDTADQCLHMQHLPSVMSSALQGVQYCTVKLDIL